MAQIGEAGKRITLYHASSKDKYRWSYQYYICMAATPQGKRKEKKQLNLQYLQRKKEV